MNIIVPSNEEIKITDNSITDINKVKIFIANDLVTDIISTKVVLKLSTTFISYDDTEDIYDLQQQLNYSLTVVYTPKFDKQNYRGFTLSYPMMIPALEDGYTAVLYIGEKIIDFGTTHLYLNNLPLQDDANIVLISDRTIAPIKTAIVAQDRNSQQITFQIKEKYDGVSLLDPSKKVFIDYIPVDEVLLTDQNGDKVSFLSDEILNKIPITLGEDKWVQLKWNVPFAATCKQGTVKFAIAVVNEERSYVWQTFPSSFTVSANLGLRPSIEVENPEQISKLNQLIDDVSDLKELVGNQSNEDLSDDETMIFDAGGAQ